ncbi:MAG: FBP domain-containing protein [Bdellovibrionaceae bacterium]|nr:FBP domain-containing protein [Pseudobdellovibrionaceae bacterium]
MERFPSSTALQDHSFQLASAEEVLECFREKERRKVLLPRLMPFPVIADYYYAWSEASGVYLYLIFRRPDWKKPRGVVFKRMHAMAEGQTGRMCDWCHAYGGSDKVGMMTTALDAQRSAGLVLCLDLACFDKLETISNQSKKPIEKLAGGLLERMGAFVTSARHDEE